MVCDDAASGLKIPLSMLHVKSLFTFLFPFGWSVVGAMGLSLMVLFDTEKFILALEQPTEIMVAVPFTGGCLQLTLFSCHCPAWINSQIMKSILEV